MVRKLTTGRGCATERRALNVDDAERKFFEAGRQWDNCIGRIALDGPSNEALLQAVKAAGALLVCYAERDRERLDYPQERFRHWFAHVVCALFIAALLIEVVSK